MTTKQQQDQLHTMALFQDWKEILQSIRNIEIPNLEDKLLTESVESQSPALQHVLVTLSKMAELLLAKQFPREAQTFQHVYSLSMTPETFGGLGLAIDKSATEDQQREVTLLLSACELVGFSRL